MFTRTDDGKAVDPPVIPEWEQRIYAAQTRAATRTELERLSSQYDDERQALANELDQVERDDASEVRPGDPLTATPGLAGTVPPTPQEITTSIPAQPAPDTVVTDTTDTAEEFTADFKDPIPTPKKRAATKKGKGGENK